MTEVDEVNRRHTDLETVHRWFDWLESHTNFDQLILETANGKDFWLHVSCRKNLRANRHQVIRCLKKWIREDSYRSMR